MTDKEKCIFKGANYSHGAIKCSNGKEIECDDGVWVKTGSSCMRKEIPNNNMYLEKDEIISLSEEEETKLEAEYLASENKYGEVPVNPFGTKEITVYAWSMFIRKGPNYYYWEGGGTPGRVCSGSTQKYEVPVDDIVSIGRRIQCSSNPTRHYQKIVFVWPT